MAERELELSNLLRAARLRTLEYARQQRRLAPKIESEKAWVKYFRLKARATRKPEDTAKLREHQERLALYESRREIYRLAGRYSRTRKPEDLVRLRQRQTEYYAVKATAIEKERPREAARIRRRFLPPPEAYKEWQEQLRALQETLDALEAQHKRYKDLIATGRWLMLSPTQRLIIRKTLQSMFAERYTQRQEIEARAKPELSLSEYTRRYFELKRQWERKQGRG